MPAMPPPAHQVIPAGPHREPAPFSHFALRSDEPAHAWMARTPLGCVHRVRTRFLDAAALAGLAAQGQARMALPAPLDISHADATPADLAAAAPHIAGLPGQITAALQLCGLPGARQAGTMHHLGCRGAGFHNDVGRHWGRCLFWVLALAVDDVEFVQPHSGLRLPLAPGDLLVFDPAMAHGLCRPADGGQALAASFERDGGSRQWFLTGELPFDDAQWAALGAPWLPLAQHADALDLLVASFDACSGAIQRPRALRGCMQPGVCHAELPAP